MSHAIIVPMTAQGTIIDTNIDDVIATLANAPFNFSDVFIFSHGWWTTADAAVIDYADFSTGFAAILMAAPAGGAGPASSLEIGIHWPSTVSDDSNLLTNIAEPFTFFNRAQMADTVGQNGGYSLIRLILEALPAGAPVPRFHLLGHSFGAKVVCSALEYLTSDPALAPLLAGVHFNVVLLQGAFDNDAFQASQAYSEVIPNIPNLRLLITKSALDVALNSIYKDAHRLANLFSTPTPALGAAGPSAATFAQLNGTNIPIAAGYIPTPGSLTGQLIVADLTSLHTTSTVPVNPVIGHHTDIFHPEIYRLISNFLFGP